MEAFIAAVIVFAVAFLGMALGVIRGKHCLGCSCKAVNRIMKEAKPSDSPPTRNVVGCGDDRAGSNRSYHEIVRAGDRIRPEGHDPGRAH